MQSFFINFHQHFSIFLNSISIFTRSAKKRMAIKFDIVFLCEHGAATWFGSRFHIVATNSKAKWNETKRKTDLISENKQFFLVSRFSKRRIPYLAKNSTNWNSFVWSWVSACYVWFDHFFSLLGGITAINSIACTISMIKLFDCARENLLLLIHTHTPFKLCPVCECEWI